MDAGKSTGFSKSEAARAGHGTTRYQQPPLSRSIGFQRTPGSYGPGQLAQSHPTPEPLHNSTQHPQVPLTLAKRPKGRLLTACVFCSCLFLAGHVLWNVLFRYQGHGIVVGRVLEVAAKWDGTVSAVHVRDGDLVDQGQPLFSLHNEELEQQLRRLEDELRVATVSLDAEIYEVKWESQTRSGEDHKAAAEFHQQLAELEAQRTQHSVLQAQLKRMRSLKTANAISVKAAELEALQISASGQRLRTDELSRAADEMKKYAQSEVDHELGAFRKLQSRRASLDALGTKIERLREHLAEGLVRSPANGRVLKKRRFTGEFAKAGEPIIDVLEDGSVQANLFLPQRAAQKIAAGQNLLIRFDANGAQIACNVKRLGNRLEPPPKAIQRYYRKDEPLLSVHVEIPLDLRVGRSLPLGSIVRLPRPFPNLLTQNTWASTYDSKD